MLASGRSVADVATAPLTLITELTNSLQASLDPTSQTWMSSKMFVDLNEQQANELAKNMGVSVRIEPAPTEFAAYEPVRTFLGGLQAGPGSSFRLFKRGTTIVRADFEPDLYARITALEAELAAMKAQTPDPGAAPAAARRESGPARGTRSRPKTNGTAGAGEEGGESDGRDDRADSLRRTPVPAKLRLDRRAGLSHGDAPSVERRAAPVGHRGRPRPEEADSVPGIPDQFFISRGMAIDAYGREIVVAVDYVLSEDDIRVNRIEAAGDYWLSIAYERNLGTPPAPGFRLCDVTDQYTRWLESYDVLIMADDPLATSIEPGVSDPLSDDPAKKPWPVTLGKVRIAVDPTTTKLRITQVFVEQRPYIGLRAQRVVAPVASIAAGVAEAKRPITVEPDLLELKNLAIGEDFFVDKNKVQPPPAAATFPTETGNLKVATDRVLQGRSLQVHRSTGPVDCPWRTTPRNCFQTSPRRL